MGGKKESKEKKLVFAPALAPMVESMLARIAEQENGDIWHAVTFDNDAKQVLLVVSRHNSRTNAYPQKAGETDEAPASRSAKSATAYYYTLALTSILWNNSARLFYVGTDRVWRVDAASAPRVEINESEMAILRQCVDDALAAKIVKVDPFKVRPAKAPVAAASSEDGSEPDAAESAEPAEEADEEDADEEDEPSWLDTEEDADEEEGEEENEDDRPCKRPCVGSGLLAIMQSMKLSLDANVTVQREIADLLQAQTALLKRLMPADPPQEQTERLMRQTRTEPEVPAENPENEQ